MKVLIAEDDENIRTGLVELLSREGYDPTPARDGREALELFGRQTYDLVCLDIMMPGMSGYDVCRKIRAGNARVPILFISAKSEEFDKVLGLELGADDFITKPFGIREVMARIRAIARRCLASSQPDLTARSFMMNDLEVLPAQLRARRRDVTFDLGPRDVKILELLHRNRGQVVSRDDLYTTCWGSDHIPNSRTVDQHISQLRKRIELDPKEPTIIRTVHGAGYRHE
ncbi:MAG: response regulator transcription factor [Candidatus Riflebacteria bacterium]|nr:response regulator transcription factor [Candidatus Riflebacteria bacterium]